MKQLKIFLQSMILTSLILLSISPMARCAQNSGVSITSVNAVLLQTKTLGNREVHYYKLIVVLHNYGSTSSSQISVKFHDPEYNTSYPPMILSPENYSLQPGESKIFNFSEWPTQLTGDVPLNISFSPTAQNSEVNLYDAGYYIYMLHIGNENSTSSTPGFELVLLFTAFTVLVLWRKQKK